MDESTFISLGIKSIEQAKKLQAFAIDAEEGELKKTIISALWLFRYDCDLLNEAIVRHHDKKFEKLFTGVAVDDYLKKYNCGSRIGSPLSEDPFVEYYEPRIKGPERAINALAMKTLYYSNGNFEQTYRIVLRSKLFQYWGKPELGMSIDWTTGFTAVSLSNQNGRNYVNYGNQGIQHLKDLWQYMEHNRRVS